jgi:hypothetical protein
MNSKVKITFKDDVTEPIHVNKEVRQGCGLSPVLFYIYNNNIYLTAIGLSPGGSSYFTCTHI